VPALLLDQASLSEYVGRRSDAVFPRQLLLRRETGAAGSDPGDVRPEYLYYTLGKLQILKLRRDWQQQEGRKFTLQRFHDEMLRHGAPPLRLLRELMLKDRSKWNELFEQLD